MRKAKMEKRFNLVNQHFGSLLVVWRVGSQKVGHSSHSCWACKCTCGVVVEVSAKALAGGKTSCGHTEPGVFVMREVAA
jgi:hypothetical protein